MGEGNRTLLQRAEAELSDVRDIAVAGGANMSDLVDCLVNAPKGGAQEVEQTFEQALRAHLPPSAKLPALTVIEAPGEYAFFDTSTSCVAALPVAGRPTQHVEVVE